MTTVFNGLGAMPQARFIYKLRKLLKILICHSGTLKHLVAVMYAGSPRPRGAPLSASPTPSATCHSCVKQESPGNADEILKQVGNDIISFLVPKRKIPNSLAIRFFF